MSLKFIYFPFCTTGIRFYKLIVEIEVAIYITFAILYQVLFLLCCVSVRH